MKTFKNISKVLLVVVLALFLTGCRKYKQTINSEHYKIDIKTYNEYKFIYDSNYFRNVREEALIDGEGFKIGIENPIKIKNEKEFNKFKKDYKDKEDYKEVKYSGYKGFMVYTDSYVRYEIYLNINNKYILRLNIYGHSSKKDNIKEALESKEVKDILKHMKVTVKK